MKILEILVGGLGKAQIYYIVETLLRVHRFANLGVSGLFPFSTLVENTHSPRHILFPFCLPGCQDSQVGWCGCEEAFGTFPSLLHI